jgi:penicillin-binding protein 1A
MLLGGLKEGVTPLEMAYAYSTIANEGKRISGSMAPNGRGPVAIQSVEDGDGNVTENQKNEEQVLPPKVAEVEKEMLRLVVSSGTGKAAQVGDEDIWGKTGTTENYGDAWFVGGNDDMTVAIWVGYADKLQPMEYEHGGSPVAGGTFPAEIFHDFMTSWLELRQTRRLERAANKHDDSAGEVAPAVPVSPTEAPPAQDAAPTDQGTGGDQQNQGGGGGQQTPDQAPPQNQPPEQAPPTPAQPETPPPTGGGGGGVSPGGTG